MLCFWPTHDDSGLRQVSTPLHSISTHLTYAAAMLAGQCPADRAQARKTLSQTGFGVGQVRVGIPVKNTGLGQGYLLHLERQRQVHVVVLDSSRLWVDDSRGDRLALVRREVRLHTASQTPNCDGGLRRAIDRMHSTLAWLSARRTRARLRK